MKKTTIIIGPQGSGKSTLAREIIGKQEYQRYNTLLDYNQHNLIPKVQVVWFDEVDLSRKSRDTKKLITYRSSSATFETEKRRRLKNKAVIVCAQGTIDDLHDAFKEPDYEIIELPGGIR